jgi:hypothetical protein
MATNVKNVWIRELAYRIWIQNSGLQIIGSGSVRNIFSSGHSIHLNKYQFRTDSLELNQNVRCLNAPTWARVYQKAKPSAPIRPRPVTLKNVFIPLP